MFSSLYASKIKKKNSKNDSKIENIKIISIDGAIIVYTAENIIYVFIQPVVVTIYTHIYINLKESSEFLISPKTSQVTCSILKHKFLTPDRFYDLVILLPSFFFYFL